MCPSSLSFIMSLIGSVECVKCQACSVYKVCYLFPSGCYSLPKNLNPFQTLRTKYTSYLLIKIKGSKVKKVTKVKKN